MIVFLKFQKESFYLQKLHVLKEIYNELYTIRYAMLFNTNFVNTYFVY
jgi:hypothetical protein